MKNLIVIIVNYNLTNCIKVLLNSIYKYSKEVNFEIYVVDNNSPDRSIEQLIPLFPKVKFELLKTNYGFGHANNYVIKKVESKYYFLINPDAELIENSIKSLYDFMELHKNIGVAGHTHLRKDGTIQISDQSFPGIIEEMLDIFSLSSFYSKIQKKIRSYFGKNDYYYTDFVFGSCMMIRKEVFDVIKGFDEDYFLFSEETDLCYRIKYNTNYKVAFVKNIKMIHLGGKITNKVKAERIKRGNESKLLFFVKNYSYFKQLILRFLKVVSFSCKVITIYIKGKSETKASYIKVYKYLVRYYYQGKPKLNERR